MKILAVSDIHGNKKALKELKKKSREADLMIVAGDFTFFEENIKGIMKTLNSFNILTLIMQGNHESPDTVRELSKEFENLYYIDENMFEIEGYLFIGIEGNGFAREDEYFERVADSFIPLIRERREVFKKQGKKLKLILITHAPPYNTKVDQINDSHAGNKSIRRFITKIKPDLCVCGHIHESAGQRDKLAGCLLVNPGAFGELIELS